MMIFLSLGLADLWGLGARSSGQLLQGLGLQNKKLLIPSRPFWACFASEVIGEGGWCMELAMEDARVLPWDCAVQTDLTLC